MKKILWVGDGPDVQSGFGKATREIVASLDYRLGGDYDVTVLGINAGGDPGTVPYQVYTCFMGGDGFGVGRIVWMCQRVKPDVIIIQQDGWNFPAYIEQLNRFKNHAPVIAAVAVDGKNFDGRWLDGVVHAIFWTDFALAEARDGGYIGPATVIPLGVDTKIYYPGDQKEARKSRKLDQILDAFIVGNVNRNQPRKRLDLCLRYFAKWIKQLGSDVTDRQIRDAPFTINDAWLYLHVAPTGDIGFDIVKLAKYYGVGLRLALMTPDTFYGVSEEVMLDTFNSFDVYASTTQGEGMGLPAMEAMACRVPCVLPDWSAYGEWARDATLLVPCTSTCIGAPYVNVIGGVPDEAQFIAALDFLYRDKIERTRLASRGLARARESRFQWANIGQRYAEMLEGVLRPVVKESRVEVTV